MLYTVVSFIIVLSILVVIHEWGHFYIARRNGVKILKFSVGFGPKLFGKKVGDTEYVISAIPLGGYVKMAGENPDEVKKEPDEFASKTVWQRAKIVFAGPFMNFALAFALMPLVFLIGTKIPAFFDEPAKIGWIDENSPAQSAGIRPGDIIKALNHREIDTWEKLMTQIAANPNTMLEITFQRGSELKTTTMKNSVDAASGAGYAGLYPEMPVIIGQIKKGFPAEKAKLAEGDKVISVNGIPVSRRDQFTSVIKKSLGQEVHLTVEREGAVVKVTLTPVRDASSGMTVIGVALTDKVVFKRFGLLESIKRGFAKTMELIALTFDILKKLVTLQLSIKSLGGPVAIAQLTGQAAHSGVGDLISLMAFLSLQLAIMNLLPVPVLDGGWLVFLGIEAVLGKPLNQKGMQIAQTIGFAALMTLFFVVSYNDIIRSFAK